MDRTIPKCEVESVHVDGTVIAVPKEVTKSDEPALAPYVPPVVHIAKGNRQAKGRAKLLKALKRKAVTMSKRGLGRRLTDGEMRQVKGAAVQWMAAELAAV